MKTMRAWHAGAGSWAGRGDVNSRSIGIELANAGPLAGFPPFPEPQMVALERLLDAILPRWSIPAAGVIAHSDLAPGRKADPGPKFDWRRLARGGRALWAEPAAAGAAAADWARACRRARPRPSGLARRPGGRRLAGPARRGAAALAALGERPGAGGCRRGGARGLR